MDSRFPGAGSVFDCYVDAKARSWQGWAGRLSGSFKPRADLPHHRLLVPTTDTLRTSFVVGTLLRAGCHTLLVGDLGAGKSVTLAALLEGLPADKYASAAISLCACTSSNSLQARDSERRLRQGHACLGCAHALHAARQLTSPLALRAVLCDQHAGRN